MIIFIKTSIRKGIKIRNNFDQDALEATFLKTFFGLEKDVKYLFTYASPINSPYTKSRTVNILDKIETQYIDANHYGIIMGDLNGKTKKDEDFVQDNLDKHSPINILPYNKDPLPLKRQNMDEHATDEQGKVILNLCKNSALRILNGRIPGDDSGRYTRYPSRLENNPSTIDYAICSVALIENIKSFYVFTYTGLSDHCCISVTMKSNINKDILLPNAGKKHDDTLTISKINLSLIKHVNIYTNKPCEEIRTLKNLIRYLCKTI